MKIEASNLEAFTRAAIARAKVLKADKDENQQALGELLAHTAGVIRAVVAFEGPVNPNRLKKVFEVGGVEYSFKECLPAARREIKAICQKL